MRSWREGAMWSLVRRASRRDCRPEESRAWVGRARYSTFKPAYVLAKVLKP